MNRCCCCESAKWTSSLSVQESTTNSDVRKVSVNTQADSKLNGSSDRVRFAEERKVPDYVRVLMVTDMNGRKKQMFIPAALDLERPKRPRTTFTESQLNILEREFGESHFISESKRQKLSASLGLSETQIKVWFQNRRTKYRRAGKCPDSTRNLCESSVQTRNDGSLAYGTSISWQPYPFPFAGVLAGAKGTSATK